ncbi:cilia- and flagella-associated protein 68 isoform X3 [Neofelis nebulosa]|uniref:cilia- and flagella-associated protein 68 isoform X3 n=1 Tax=Neofelis nebulosa TaxID=61452 RepID=UPI0027295BB3|nr:cilia- and flagella-associated protein 68 isoform X3 [Neofelis nebulosa]
MGNAGFGDISSFKKMEELSKIFYHCPMKSSNNTSHSTSKWSSVKRQALAYFFANPHYGSIINADGHAEVWTDWNSMSKFFQYGWRCTTNENTYSNRTLMGNWNQERYDLRNIVQPKPLPSQDLSESLTRSQDINLSWILLDTNAQKSQLI